MNPFNLKKTPTPGQAPGPQLATPKSKFGGQLSETSLDILRDVHAHPGDQYPERAKRVGAISNLSSRLNHLVGSGYLQRLMLDGRPQLVRLTAKGGRAIDVLVIDEPPPPKVARVCNAAMIGTTLDLSRHTHMGRIGLAMCGVGGR